MYISANSELKMSGYYYVASRSIAVERGGYLVAEEGEMWNIHRIQIAVARRGYIRLWWYNPF